MKFFIFIKENYFYVNLRLFVMTHEHFSQMKMQSDDLHSLENYPIRYSSVALNASIYNYRSVFCRTFWLKFASAFAIGYRFSSENAPNLRSHESYVKIQQPSNQLSLDSNQLNMHSAVFSNCQNYTRNKESWISAKKYFRLLIDMK